MRFEIRYRTHFAYSEPVRESHNEVRACPAHDDRQWLLSYDLDVWPAARVQSFTDYWGTRVDAFGVRSTHTHLDILARAAVQTNPAATPEGVAAADFVDVDATRTGFHELLQPTSLTAWSPALRREARRVVEAGGAEGTVAMARALHRHVHDHLTYTPGSTDVDTTALDAWDDGRGVCQDYAHLLVAMARSVGLPARYVSGYLFTTDESSPDPDAVPEGAVEVQTHAWVEVAVAPGQWLALDPTGGVDVGVRHVEIGHGRDYADVAPVHGVYGGDARATVASAVTIQPLEAGRPLVVTPTPAEPATRHLPRDPSRQRQQQQ